MQHRLLLLVLACGIIATSLASCGPAATPVVLAPTAAASSSPVPLPSTTPERLPLPTVQASETPRPSPIPSLTLVPSSPATRTSTAFPTGAATPTPTVPPIQTPAAGEPVPLGLGWWYGANGHLTEGAVVTLAGQTAYVAASLDRTIYAWDAAGEIRWQAHLAGPAYALAALDGERLAVGDGAGRVALLNAAGRPVWHHDLGGRVTDLAAWSDGLLAGGWSGQVTLLDTEGRPVWQADIEEPVAAVSVLPNLALAATTGGAIQAFDPAGSEMWRFEAGAPIFALGVVEGFEALVLASTQDGRLLALDESGVRRWQQWLGQGAPVWHEVDLAGDGAVQIIAGVAGDDAYLSSLSIEGQVLWRVGVPAPVWALAAVDLESDGVQEILAGLADGQLQVYDGQGRLRNTVHVGLPVWDLAIGDATENSPSGEIFVLADVMARRIVVEEGPAGGPWLPPPPVVETLPQKSIPGTGRQEGEAILAFLGDVAPARSVERQLARYGMAYPWQAMGPLLQDADLAVANLECVLTTQGTALDKQYLMRAHPDSGATLAEAGLDLVTVANNHALDYGQVGLEETLDTLAGLDIDAIGAGRSRDEAHRPAIYTLNEVRVAVLGYAAARWDGSTDVPATDRVAWGRPAEVRADVQAVRDRADVVVVLLHAGTEYAGEPSPDQVAVARAAVDVGADLVVGHHPHVTQTIERYEGGLVVYSLGDALFDIPLRAAMQGDLLRVHVTKEGVAQAEIWPFWIDGAIQPRLLDDGQGQPRFRIIYP